MTAAAPGSQGSNSGSCDQALHQSSERKRSARSALCENGASSGCWWSASRLTQRRLCNSTGCTPASRSTATSIDGGSIDTGITDEATMPCGWPCRLRVVTIITDDARRRMASQKPAGMAAWPGSWGAVDGMGACLLWVVRSVRGGACWITANTVPGCSPQTNQAPARAQVSQRPVPATPGVAARCRRTGVCKTAMGEGRPGRCCRPNGFNPVASPQVRR